MFLAFKLICVKTEIMKIRRCQVRRIRLVLTCFTFQHLKLLHGSFYNMRICIVVVKNDKISSCQNRPFFFNPSIFKCRQAVEISIFEILATYSFGILGLFSAIASRMTSATSEVRLRHIWTFRIKSAWIIQPNHFLSISEDRAWSKLISRMFFFYRSFKACRNSYSIIWRKCNFYSSIFKAFICGENVNIQQIQIGKWMKLNLT